MPLIGIVCEYNPFHNGHRYLIDTVKKEGDTVIAVMSGNFVQRAEPALFPKEVRVRSALAGGVDIAVELPFLYASATAEIFARNAVKILDSLGCDRIAFGSESGDIEELQSAAGILLTDSFDKRVKTYLESGISYPAARQRAYDEAGGSLDISAPNNILALEYIKAVNSLKSDMVPVAVKRRGAGYNEIKADGNFGSATLVRRLIGAGESFESLVPERAAEIYKAALKNGDYTSYEKYSTAMLALLRSKMTADCKNAAYTAEGLENRIKSAVNGCTHINALYDTAKTKRFTHSRIRRTVLSLCFDITEQDIKIPVPYVRLLGFNKGAEKTLGAAVKSCKISFAVNYKDIAALDSAPADRVFALENRASDFYNIILNRPRPCSTELTYMPVKTV